MLYTLRWVFEMEMGLNGLEMEGGCIGVYTGRRKALRFNADTDPSLLTSGITPHCWFHAVGSTCCHPNLPVSFFVSSFISSFISS